MKTGLHWFTNDLRVADNLALKKLTKQAEQAFFCYVIDESLFKDTSIRDLKISYNRWQFLKQSLTQLASIIESTGGKLIIAYGDTAEIIADLVELLSVDVISVNRQVGYYEQQRLANFHHRAPSIEILSDWCNTLFNAQDVLPFVDTQKSFSRFRSKVEKSQLHAKIQTCKSNLSNTHTPQPPAEVFERTYIVASLNQIDEKFSTTTDVHSTIEGGYYAAQNHLETYFGSGAASNYKQTRNQLQGENYSTGFSPWLANGCLSPKQVWERLLAYEEDRGANESTNWIGFELIWREFFHWLALKQGPSLFQFKGLYTKSPNTCFYPERFKKWCSGDTPFALVNALMKQLNQTGLMSNRGRQIAASCLVNELQLDWRYGASYFESQLLDYDVASNWGNWQYLAGVGVDPRGGRWFDIDKQTKQYDPQGQFIKQWDGMPKAGSEVLDSTDAADWPVS